MSACLTGLIGLIIINVAAMIYFIFRNKELSDVSSKRKSPLGIITREDVVTTKRDPRI